MIAGNPDQYRVVITGIGLTAPNGDDLRTYRQALLAGTSHAFVSQQRAAGRTSQQLNAAPEGAWDPLSLATLGDGDAFDTFPNMFPKYQFLAEAEVKHGRQAMLGWTGIWATHQVKKNSETCLCP